MCLPHIVFLTQNTFCRNLLIRTLRKLYNYFIVHVVYFYIIHPVIPVPVPQVLEILLHLVPVLVQVTSIHPTYDLSDELTYPK